VDTGQASPACIYNPVNLIKQAFLPPVRWKKTDPPRMRRWRVRARQSWMLHSPSESASG